MKATYYVHVICFQEQRKNKQLSSVNKKCATMRKSNLQRHISRYLVIQRFFSATRIECRHPSFLKLNYNSVKEYY